MVISTGPSSHLSDPSDKTPGRRWRRWLLGGMLAVAFAMGAFVFWRLPIAGAVLRTSFELAGFPDARVTVTDVTLSRLRLAGIGLGAEVRVASADFTFDLIGPTGPTLTGVSLDRTRLDLTDPAGPLRQRLDKPRTAGGATTIRRILDRAATLPLMSIEDFEIRYPTTGRVLSFSGSLATERTDARDYQARYEMQLTSDPGGAVQTLAIKGTAVVGRVLSLDAALAASDKAATGSLTLRADLSETDARLSGSARIDIDQMSRIADLHPALQGARGRLSLSVRPLSAATMALDAPVDRAGLMAALGRTARDGLSIDASVEGAHHPAGLEAASATISAVARRSNTAADGLRLEGKVGLRAGRLRAGDIDLEDITLQAPVRFDWLGNSVIMTLLDRARAQAAKATARSAGIVVSPVTLLLEGDGSHAMRFNMATGQGDLGVRLDVGAASLRSGKDLARRVDLAPVTLRLSGTTDEKGDMNLQLRAPILSAAERGDAVIIEDLAATLRRVGNSHTGELRGRVSLRRVGKPFLAPTGIRSDFALRRDVMTFEGRAEAPGAVLTVEKGRHDLKTGQGHAELALQPFQFAAGRNSFRALLPGLSGFDVRTGTGDGNARLSWGGNGMEGDMSVRLDDMTIAHLSGTTISGLSARLRLDRLVPPRSPPGQTVRIRNIAAGAMLDDIIFRFALTGGPAAESTAVSIEELTMRLAGGTLTVPPTVLGSSAATSQATIDVAGIDLATLLGLLGIDGVSGTGRLSGAIPLRLNEQTVLIDSGLLAAKGPGVMKIRSAAVKKALAQGGAHVLLMLDALEDFRYETLTLKIDKALDGDGRILLSTRGHNPAVRNSQPFVINLTVSGNVDRLAAVAAQALRLPADLVRSMIPKAP